MTEESSRDAAELERIALSEAIKDEWMTWGDAYVIADRVLAAGFARRPTETQCSETFDGGPVEGEERRARMFTQSPTETPCRACGNPSGACDVPGVCG